MGRKKLPMDLQTRKYYAAYKIQRYHAGKRIIKWQFTFESWLAWWGDDIVNRGQGTGKLCMARYGDIGPYHPDNVRKATHEDNASEIRSKPVITSLGQFKSAVEASKAHNITIDIMYYRIKNRPSEYKYA
jgi:hypothetical protein